MSYIHPMPVLIDLDNTLFNWHKKLIENTPLINSMEEFNALPTEERETILRIHYSRNPNWWDDLEPMDDGIELVKWLIDNRIEFYYLSAIGKDVIRPDIAMSDKRSLIAKHIDQKFNVHTATDCYFVTESKQKKYFNLSERYILFDDFYRSCQEWENTGRPAIHFEGPSRLEDALIVLEAMLEKGQLKKL